MSLIDTASSTCGSLGLPALPTGYVYHCATATSSRLTNGQGWIPISFSSSTNPLGALPLDPQNSSSSNLYYTYQTNGSLYRITAFLESQKEASIAENDGGSDPTLMESGSGASSLPDLGRGLVGYWPLDGNANDISGDGYNMTASGGAPTWLSGSNCKVNGCASLASSTSQYEYVDNATGLNSGTGDFTYSAWVNPTRRYDNLGFSFFGNFQWPTAQSGNVVVMNPDSSTNVGIAQVYGPGGSCYIDYTSYFGSWHFISFVKQSNTVAIYVDGIQRQSCNASSYNVQLGNGRWYINNGSWRATDLSIDDLRVYDRALPAAEISALYSAEK